MKKSTKLLFSALLLISMLVCFASAADGEASEKIIVPAHYEEHMLGAFSDAPAEGSWKYRPLNCAVNNGSMNGYNGKLRPDDYLTRAEMAAMMVRVLDAFGTKADISSFVDVAPGDWFYDYIACSVGIGILKGDGNRMNPNDPITREQAFAVLARTFLIVPQTQNPSGAFLDDASVSAWAEYTTNALIDARVVLGDTRNTIRPRDNVTRAELAAMLDRIACLKLSADRSYDGVTIEGNVILSDPNVNLAGAKILGNIYITEGVGNSAIDLSNVEIEGNIIIRSGNVTVPPEKQGDVITRADYNEPTITPPNPDDGNQVPPTPPGGWDGWGGSGGTTVGSSVELVDGGTYITRNGGENFFADIYEESGYQVVEFDFRKDANSGEVTYVNLFVDTVGMDSLDCVSPLVTFKSDKQESLATIIAGILDVNANKNDDELVPVEGRLLTNTSLIDRMVRAYNMYEAGFKPAFDVYGIVVQKTEDPKGDYITATFKGEIDGKTFFLRLISPVA